VESRPICPNCRAFISRADRVCPYCEFELAPAPKHSVDATRALSNVLPRDGQISNYLLAVNGFLYLAMMLFDSQNTQGGDLSALSGITLFLFGAKEPNYIFHGEWWRLITAGFLHANLIHIGVNSFSLFNLGPQVEEAYGTGRMLVIYVLSSACGFLASSIFSPSLSIGASAAICGLIGSMIAFGLNERSSFGNYLTSNYAFSAVSMLLLTSFVSSIDNWAHFGGLAGGFVVGYLAGHPRLYRSKHSRYWDVAGWAMIALVVVSFGIQLLTTLRYLRS
jgi:rhomboid protease GluP